MTLNIILADDEEFSRDIAALFLERKGYRIFQYDNGHDAINFFQDNISLIDLIILDVMMPIKNGLETLVEIRNLQAGENIPVIFQTGNQKNYLLEQNITLKNVFILEKPYEIKQLHTLIEEIFTKKYD